MNRIRHWIMRLFHRNGQVPDAVREQIKSNWDQAQKNLQEMGNVADRLGSNCSGKAHEDPCPSKIRA